jgi:hypothetical protein
LVAASLPCRQLWIIEIVEVVDGTHEARYAAASHKFRQCTSADAVLGVVNVKLRRVGAFEPGDIFRDALPHQRRQATVTLRGGHAGTSAARRPKQPTLPRIGRQYGRFVTQRMQCVAHLQRMNDAAARIGRVGQQGHPRWSGCGACGHTHARCRLGTGAQPISGSWRRFHNGAVSDPRCIVTIPLASVRPIAAHAMPRPAKRPST